MAYGNNIAAEQPRAHFQEAGGSIIKFKHPYLVGQISQALTSVDEIDVSAALKLADTYFNATPNQDSAAQEVLIDGSTVTITNKILNGTLSLPVIPTSGTVSGGDFIAALQLIKATGDSVGGLLSITEGINGKSITTIYYGVTVKNVPDKIKMGMAVPTYPVQLLYSGWVQAISTSSEANKKAIWATGSQTGLEAAYKPYALNATDGLGTGKGPVGGAINGGSTDWQDETGDGKSGTPVSGWSDSYANTVDGKPLTKRDVAKTTGVTEPPVVGA